MTSKTLPQMPAAGLLFQADRTELIAPSKRRCLSVLLAALALLLVPMAHAQHIFGVKVTPGTTSATINWRTWPPTSGVVQYGLTNSYGESVISSGFSWSQSVTLSQLNPGTVYHFQITATDAQGNSVNSADATFTTLSAPTPTVSITIAPSSATLQTGGTQQFTATVSNTSNTAVNWTATGGSITPAGLYTAGQSTGSFTVTATSQADTTQSATAQVTVTSPPAPTAPAPAFVQVNAGSCQSGNACSLAFANNTQPGDEIIVFAIWHTTTGFPTITDLQGNAYKMAVTTASGSTSAGIGYAENIPGGTDSITVTFPSSQYVELYIHEYSGLVPSASLDTTTIGMGSLTSMSAGSLTAQANELVFAGFEDGTILTITPGFASRSQFDSNLTEDEVAGTAGLVNVAATQVTSFGWIGLAATFEPPASGAAPPPPPPAVTVSVSPTTATVASGGTQQFTATVNGTTNTAVNWTASIGTISSAGVFTAPSVTSVTSGTVTATSQAAASASASASVTVTPPAGGGSGSTPLLVRRTSGSNSLTAQLSNSPSVYHAYLPDGAVAGNTIVAAFQYDNSSVPTPTFSDDSSNTWQVACTQLDSGNNRVIGWAYASNVAAGTRQVDLSLSAAGVNDIAVHLFEFANIGAVDGCAGNFANSSSVTAGSITPTSSGDLLLAVMAKDNNDTQSTITAGAQSNITWQLATADLQDHAAMGVQRGIYNSASSITPSMSTGGSSNNSYVAASIAFKAATSGGDMPAGIGIRGILHFSRFSTSNGNGGPGYTNPTQVGFPSYGNLLVVGANGAVGNATAVLSSITDSNGNTWTQLPAANNPNGNQADEFWYCSPCTTGPNLVLTVSSVSGNGNTYNQTIMGYDIAGAASSAFDTYGDATGDETSYASSIAAASVTPSTSNGLVLCELDNSFNTVTGMGNPFLVDSEWQNNESLDGPANTDENNGWGHTYNNSTAQQTCLFTYGLHGTDAQQNWAATAAAFKAQ